MTGYTPAQRAAHAEQALLLAAEGKWLPITSCTHIARTYGVTHMLGELKRLKGSLFPAEIFNGEGK